MLFSINFITDFLTIIFNLHETTETKNAPIKYATMLKKILIISSSYLGSDVFF